jgi:hypothetical protein
MEKLPPRDSEETAFLATESYALLLLLLRWCWCRCCTA